MTTVSVKAGPDGGSPSTTNPRLRASRAIGVILAIAGGLAMAVQGRINGALAVGLGDSLLASVVSFGGGLVVLLAALLVSGRMRAGLSTVRAAVRGGRLRTWQCLGGLGGAMFVLGQSFTVGVLGVALFTVGVVAGQSISGLFVDRAGLGPAGAQAPSWPRVCGAVLAVAGALCAALGAMAGKGGAGLLLLVLPILAGGCMAVQQAVNGRVGVVAGSSFTAALVNFTVGTTALLLGWGVALTVRGGPSGLPANPGLYVGGLIGIVVIALAAYVVKLTGVLVFGLATISGQLLGSVLLDLWFPVAQQGLSATTLLGAGIALVAVLMTGLPAARPANGVREWPRDGHGSGR